MKKSRRNKIIFAAALMVLLPFLIIKWKPVSFSCRAAEYMQTDDGNTPARDMSGGKVLAQYVYYDEDGEVALVETYRSVPSSGTQTNE